MNDYKDYDNIISIPKKFTDTISEEEEIIEENYDLSFLQAVEELQGAINSSDPRVAEECLFTIASIMKCTQLNDRTIDFVQNTEFIIDLIDMIEMFEGKNEMIYDIINMIKIFTCSSTKLFDQFIEENGIKAIYDIICNENIEENIKIVSFSLLDKAIINYPCVQLVFDSINFAKAIKQNIDHSESLELFSALAHTSSLCMNTLYKARDDFLKCTLLIISRVHSSVEKSPEIEESCIQGIESFAWSSFENARWLAESHITSFFFDELLGEFEDQPMSAWFSLLAAIYYSVPSFFGIENDDSRLNSLYRTADEVDFEKIASVLDYCLDDEENPHWRHKIISKITLLIEGIVQQRDDIAAFVVECGLMEKFVIIFKCGDFKAKADQLNLLYELFVCTGTSGIKLLLDEETVDILDGLLDSDDADESERAFQLCSRLLPVAEDSEQFEKLKEMIERYTKEEL